VKATQRADNRRCPVRDWLMERTKQPAKYRHAALWLAYATHTQRAYNVPPDHDNWLVSENTCRPSTHDS